MCAGLPKVKCPTINLNWILNASADDSNEVRRFSLSSTFRFVTIAFQESMQCRQFLLPWLVATCAQNDDVATLHQIQQAKTGTSFNVVLPSGSMPLHVCAKHGAVKCADFLLRQATEVHAMVNELDQVGFSALFYAIGKENEAMIELLIKNGAKLTATLKPSEIGMYLCNCVKNNQLDRLRAWHCAGADLDQTDYDGRTPLHMVNRTNFLLLKTLFVRRR